MMSGVKEARTKGELERIIELRYRILRQPWQQPYASSSDELEETSVNAYIENEKGQVLACGRLQENENKTGQIRYMAVVENARGTGLGKKILHFLEHRAAELGFNKIILQARENALDFYLKNNYAVKEKSFLLWGKVQHYLMEKSLR
jgi:N-acetylglutamate synthase-like GNAT family acetyltransferase